MGHHPSNPLVVRYARIFLAWARMNKGMRRIKCCLLENDTVKTAKEASFAFCSGGHSEKTEKQIIFLLQELEWGGAFHKDVH